MRVTELKLYQEALAQKDEFWLPLVRMISHTLSSPRVLQ